MVGEVGRTYFVYLLASRINGTFYVGVTNNLVGRVYQHREYLVDGFTKRHNVTRLVYYEMFGDITLAIARGKQLKRYHRAWKIQLIEKDNRCWDDLYEKLF